MYRHSEIKLKNQISARLKNLELLIQHIWWLFSSPRTSALRVWQLLTFSLAGGAGRLPLTRLHEGTGPLLLAWALRSRTPSRQLPCRPRTQFPSAAAGDSVVVFSESLRFGIGCARVCMNACVCGCECECVHVCTCVAELSHVVSHM